MLHFLSVGSWSRNLDEAKLLEKAILADLPSDESDPSATATQEAGSGIPEDATVSVPAVVSAWDCVVSISLDPPPQAEPLDGDKTLQASDSTSGLARPSSLKLQSAESQRKMTPDEELRARNDEQRASLEAYWSQSTRHIQIKQAGLHRAVLAEVFHLCIELYTQSLYKTMPAVIECAADTLPEQLKDERHRRRESMSTIDRMLWMRASKDIDLPDDVFVNLMNMLQKVRRAHSICVEYVLIVSCSR